jgi:polyisoprenoid-binding protein YceI
MTNKYFYISLILLFSNSIWAKDCIPQFKIEQSMLQWTAFKTPKKAAVNVKFDKYLITSANEKSILDAISSAQFTVDVSSVNSGNPERDKKIVKFFFTQKNKQITLKGKVLSVKNNIAEVEFTIHKVSKVIPMNLEVINNNVKLTGKIDVLDFKLNDSLSAINNACKVLHEGKTWSDVELLLTAQFKDLCNSK